MFNRRGFIGAMATASLASMCGKSHAEKTSAAAPDLDELDKAAAAPVLKLDKLKTPVIIESIKLLKKDEEYFVHVRSKDGAEGVALTNPPREQYLDKILKQLVIPFFIGKDARDLENLLWELYRWKDNYKLYGLALWSPQAWVEFAILDMLGRITGQPIGALLGEILRQDVAIYVASGRRDTTPEQEVEYLQKLVEQSGAKAVKFRLGGRMSRNADAMPGRTERLIPLVRKTFGDAIDIHGDSNSSYDAAHAIKVGRILEEVKAVYFEEPCQFDHLEETKEVADALTIPVAGGEQEYSDWRFRWMIANRGVDIVKRVALLCAGMIGAARGARMAPVEDADDRAHFGRV